MQYFESMIYGATIAKHCTRQNALLSLKYGSASVFYVQNRIYARIFKMQLTSQLSPLTYTSNAQFFLSPWSSTSA
jgi:hypothetical protein